VTVVIVVPVVVAFELGTPKISDAPHGSRHRSAERSVETTHDLS